MKYFESLSSYLSILLLFAFISSACHSKDGQTDNSYEDSVRIKAEAFFETFAERSDWDKMCSFYREDVQFKDVMLQLDLDSLWQLKRFYKWDEEGDRFKKLFPEQKHLEVVSLVVDGDLAVAKGHLNPFYYDGELIDVEWGMDFTIWLRFDDSLKIIEQIDWFEYDPVVQESTIERCREFGFETTPEWLDLSRDN